MAGAAPPGPGCPYRSWPTPAARRLATAGPWADLEAADENRVRQDWRRHVAGWQALEDVEAAAARALDEAVRAALVAGALWADIGRATGLAGRSATERWSARG